MRIAARRLLSMTSLRSRVGTVLSTLFGTMLVIGIAWWMHGTRHAIHEEVEAATRVAEQWLTVLIPETLDGRGDGMDQLTAHLAAVGRLRANRLEIVDAGGTLLYVSPEPTWKAGRSAPEWFERRLGPVVATRSFTADDHRIVLRPDTSRAILDAWDDLVAGLGWAGVFLLLAWLGTRIALNRALAPLAQINAALARSADGMFDIRLPVYRISELDHLAGSYNRLADSLDQTRTHNRRLEQDQALTHAIQARLEEERRLIACELHDEFGQAITAVRAIAGAIQQRCDHEPGLHGSAQAILAMTGQMQDGVRTILQRLRTPDRRLCARLDEIVADYCALWSDCHPGIEMNCRTSPADDAIDEELAFTVLRLLQEGLTNVARHARASRVDIGLRIDAAAIELSIRDNGCGLSAENRSSRFGILGMQERVARLDGDLRFESPRTGGLSIRARLPHAPAEMRSHDTTA